MASADPIPKESVAAIQNPNTLAISPLTRPTPIPSTTQVLVKISFSGLCAADLHLARRNLPYLLPTVSIFGHEGTGTIAALGLDVDPSVWHVGDRVGIRWLHSVCQSCELCTSSHENLCMKRIITGKDVEGAFAEYALAESRYLVQLPPDVGDSEAAPVLCAGVTVYKGLKIAGLKRGSWVAVSGAGGGLGHLAVQYAKAMGLRVVALDVRKRDICIKLGAEVYVEVEGNEAIVKDVVEATNGGAHGVLVCASSGKAYADAVGYLRRAGTLVCIGAPAKASQLPVSPDDFIAKGIRIMGTSTGTLQDTQEALSFLSRGEVKPHISERGLHEVDQALTDLEAGAIEGRIVIHVS